MKKRKYWGKKKNRCKLCEWKVRARSKNMYGREKKKRERRNTKNPGKTDEK